MSLEKIIAGNIVNGGIFFIVGVIPPYPTEMGYSLTNYSIAFGGIVGTMNWKILPYLRKAIGLKETGLEYSWDEAAATSPGAIIGLYFGCTAGQYLFR